MEEVKIKKRSEQLLKTYYYTKGYTFGRADTVKMLLGAGSDPNTGV